MIWHFFEVWLLIVMTFCIGCVLGAFLYGALADSRFAVAQGAVADGVGDLVDWFKVRTGFGPAWRPKQNKLTPRPAQPAPALPVAEPVRAERFAPPAEPERRREPRRELPREEPRAATPRMRPPRAEMRPAALPIERRPVAPPVAEEPPESGDPVRVASAGEVRDDGVMPMRPAGLAAPRAGVPDSLTRIKGIGQRNEELLNSLGIYHFGQIAAWTAGEVRWIGQYLSFPDRIERDNWVEQATLLASGVDTGFEKSAERRRRRRSELQQEFRARLSADQARVAAEGAGAGPDESNMAPAESRPADEPQTLDDDWSVDEPADALDQPPGESEPEDETAGEAEDETTADDYFDAGEEPADQPAGGDDPTDDPDRES